MLDLNKPLRIKGTKQPVRVICTDRVSKEGRNFVGLYKSSSGDEVITSFDANGVGLSTQVENVPETITAYMNVYPDRFATYPRLDQAEIHKSPGRVSLLKIEILDGEIVSSERLK